jgi:4-alpha-glucanotransferase
MEKNKSISSTSKKSVATNSKTTQLKVEKIRKEKKAIQKVDLVEAPPKKIKAIAEPIVAKAKSKPIEMPKKPAKPVVKNVPITTMVTLKLRFSSSYGQKIYVTGNHELLGNGNVDDAIEMQFVTNEFWIVQIPIATQHLSTQPIFYNYFIKNADGLIEFDCGNDKSFTTLQKTKNELFIIDSWNFTGYTENAFYTKPFIDVLLQNNFTKVDASNQAKATHTFQTKTPLLPQGQTLCLIGSGNVLGNWDTSNPILMAKSNNDVLYKVAVDLSKQSFPIVYKYGVFDVENNTFIRFEEAQNRIIYDNYDANKYTIINDAFAAIPFKAWKGAGVAIPVFSLKTNDSFGIGEFADLKKLADWGHKIGLKLIQILPINDTIATNTWQDSYPYAAISAFALHPIYINLEATTDAANKPLLKKLNSKKEALNALEKIDFEEVIKVKMSYLQTIFALQKEATFKEEAYTLFLHQNKHWLHPYACFCYYRDKFGTANYNLWPAFTTYKESLEVDITNEILFYYFVQYHLHLQLKDATNYAHQKQLVVKGDIAIGIYRYGADAWQQPHLYNMNLQAGAPPDDFAVKGQNWGFPTYNWQQMAADGFLWWKQRFEQMNHYFDAFRIDHILGFFRIWSIPLHAVEGILGHFVPAIPVHINEILSKNINFNVNRFTQPFINETVLWDIFGYDAEYVKNNFLNYNNNGTFSMQKSFATQREVEQHFETLEETDFNNKIKIGLYDIISNVILFEIEGSNAQQFHFRLNIEGTSSYKNLDTHSQQQLSILYVDYFYRRQDDFWKQEALQKIPTLRRVTNMLICGEDLGMVPACVPDVMQKLGLLSLEIQRMPKDDKKQFFHPADAPYLSVVTPSTHDMSIIRGWWEEDANTTAQFYKNELGQWGNAPFYCETWINKLIISQHLYSPAMWAIFQLQDLMSSDEILRSKNPNDDRINVPANPKHYWQYRMNITIENLMKEDNFNNNLQQLIAQSGR